MNEYPKPITILIADDDADDRMLARDAFEENQHRNRLQFVADGNELMDYLYRRNQYLSVLPAPRPDLILLDLNMPGKDGREALCEIKSDPYLRTIPIVILTTSRADTDIIRTYDLGANSFITKPDTFEELVNVVNHLIQYWFHIVRLPSPDLDSERTHLISKTNTTHSEFTIRDSIK